MPKKTTTAQLPDWLDAGLWREFLAHRKALKKPMTEYAQALAFKLLERLKAAGHCPRASIEQSIFNGWQGLFEPRAETIKPAAQSDYERTKARNAREDANAPSADELRANAILAREKALAIKRGNLTH